MLAPGERGQACIGSDAIQPRSHTGTPRVVPVRGAPGTQQCFLHGVFGLVVRAQYSIAMGEQLAAKFLVLRLGGGGPSSFADLSHPASLPVDRDEEIDVVTDEFGRSHK
jgi:hypothetical protein